jgi:superkiller protein 3
LGYGLHQRGQITEAEACYQKAIERQPDFAVAHYNLHFCFLANGERQKAIESLSTAVRYKPDVAKAHRALGMLYLETGKTSEARAALMRAIELDPADQEARDLLARLPESAPLRAP